MKSTPVFGDIVRELKGVGGFPASDLLPLIPPGAKLSSQSKVAEHQIGKIPGKYSNGVWSGLTGSWPTFGLAPQDQERSSSWPTQNVGLRGADFPAIDIDTETPEALALVRDLISEMFEGDLPVRTRGNAPRALYVFKKEGDIPIRKNRIEFKSSPEQKKPHAVEVLALGQQYVIHGMHPTGVAFEWEDRNGQNGDLTAYGVNGLTAITAAKVAEFMGALHHAIEARGWTIESMVKPTYGPKGREAGVLVEKADPIIDDPDLVLAALKAVPNTVETLPQREDLVRLLSSVKYALGKKADCIKADVIAWGIEHGWADPDYIEKIWDSLTTASVPPDYLLQKARKYGWHGDAVLDFQSFDDEVEETKSVEEKIQRAQDEAADRREMLGALAKELVYVPTDQCFVFVDTGDMMSDEALNKCARARDIAPAGATGQRTAANQLRNERGILREVLGVAYLPGMKRLTKWEARDREGIYFNKWRPKMFALPDDVTDEDVKPWLEHAEYLFPVKAEREFLFDYLAHIIQKRGEKIRFAPLIIGKQGTGKDLFIQPVLKYLAHNARDLRPEQISAKFNDFLENELLVVQELKKTHKTTDLYEQAKPYLAGTGTDLHAVEQKYKAPYLVPNRVNFIMFSNHIDCIDLDPDDRRLFILYSTTPKKEASYYTNLAENFYDKQSGWRKVIRWLMQRDLSGFNVNEAPMETSGRIEMVGGQQSTVSSALETAITTGIYSARKSLTVLEVFEAMKTDFNFPGMDAVARSRLNTKNKVTQILQDLGWRHYPNPISLPGEKGQIRVWYRPDVEPDLALFRSEYLAAQEKLRAERN